MTDSRWEDYLRQLQQAAQDAVSFAAGMSEDARSWKSRPLRSA